MVSTLDFESSDPSSNLGRTWHNLTPWRNGSASDSRSEGCVFESRRGQNLFACFTLELQLEKYCLQWGLNSWPLVYKTNALPLSYRGYLRVRVPVVWNKEESAQSGMTAAVVCQNIFVTRYRCFLPRHLDLLSAPLPMCFCIVHQF